MIFVYHVFVLTQVLSQGESVLVHCVNGAHRSPSTVLKYLMDVEGFEFFAALHLVQQHQAAEPWCLESFDTVVTTGSLIDSEQFRQIWRELCKKNGAQFPPDAASRKRQRRS